MTQPAYPLFARLPEIHRIRDEDRALERFLGLVEREFGAIHQNIAALYDDHFIDTCADWAIPYIGDLVGTSALGGDPHGARADVAATVAMRRRKGTLAAIELLVYSITRWGVHAVELRERLVWHQHLNHQRPALGRTVSLRDPASLTLLGGPFDPFAHLADPRPPAADAIRYNLPNLAIFLWRLAAYRIPVTRPVPRQPMPIVAIAAPAAGDAAFIVRFYVHPMGEPIRLFNRYRFDPEQRPLAVGELDETPNEMPAARLTTGSPAGNPDAYVRVATYDAAAAGPPQVDISDHGLQLHVPAAALGGAAWTFRGANLCAWETGLRRPLRDFEVAIDPVIGRLAIGVPTMPAANALRDQLLITYTYGAVGPIGAHPEDSRGTAPQEWEGEPVDLRQIVFDPAVNVLEQQLDNIESSPRPIVIEIGDSRTYDLDLAVVAGTIVEDGGPNLRLNRTLVIRAAHGERPVIRLAAPLRFRPTNVADPNPAVQAQYDAVMARLAVRLEGLYLVRDPALVAADPDAPIVARAALNRLEVLSCTLDPGGFLHPDLAARDPIRRGMMLRDGFGFGPGTPEDLAFSQQPQVVIQRSVTGALRIDEPYPLTIEDSIVDGGRGVADPPDAAYALTAATDPVNGWGPPTSVAGATFFGRTRVARMDGCGAIFVHALQVQDTQRGCIKQSYFAASTAPGLEDRLPQRFGYVTGAEAHLGFTAQSFGAPGYGQLTRDTDFRIRSRGPGDDAMGATGFLAEDHKWRNLQTRFREYMPVGIRPLPIPVT